MATNCMLTATQTRYIFDTQQMNQSKQENPRNKLHHAFQNFETFSFVVVQ